MLGAPQLNLVDAEPGAIPHRTVRCRIAHLYLALNRHAIVVLLAVLRKTHFEKEEQVLKCLALVLSVSLTIPFLGSAGEPTVLQSDYAKWRAALPDDYPQLADYRRILLFWVTGAEPYWLQSPARPKLGKCTFTEKHVHVRTARVLPAYAALAADPDCRHPVWTRPKLVERLNSAIGFLCATYSYGKPAKGSWGKRPHPNSLRYETWVIGNMVDALQIVPEAITPEHKESIRKILIDVIEDERTSGRARSLTDYRHEGITWTMNLLARAAALYPDDPRAGEWMALAKYGYASSLSVEADTRDETVVDGKPIKEWVARRQGVFHPDFTLSHHRPPERLTRAVDALRLVGLEQFVDARPHQLSGGMRQRVALARVLVMEPASLLVDEPFGAVDENTRECLQDQLLDIWSVRKTTVVFVTHNVEEAAYLADRVVVLGPPPESSCTELTVAVPRPRDRDSPELRTFIRQLRSEMAAMPRSLDPSCASTIPRRFRVASEEGGDPENAEAGERHGR